MITRFNFIPLLIFVFLSSTLQAQFHNVRMPQQSPSITTTHQLGISDITIAYSSPAVRGREVWNGVVPFEGKPLPWRAGANMNTKIKFSTDVTLNGIPVKSGAYGLHLIPHKEGKWELLIASNDNLWGSYYLDLEKDIAHTIEVEPEECAFQEALTYRFINRTDSTIVLALEWADKRIPVTIGVDLNKTVLAHFRYQLRGLETYRWEAWNDAANWCAQRNTNLEEALSWADRSINGGYGGFASNKNMSNLGTKIKILSLLDKQKEADALVAEAKGLIKDPYEAYTFGTMWLRNNDFKRASSWYETAAKSFNKEEGWFLHMRHAISLYMDKQKGQALEILNSLEEDLKDPQGIKMIGNLKSSMESGEFSLR